jgi:glycosyltransferase involved in cell wall biosynthesis
MNICLAITNFRPHKGKETTFYNNFSRLLTRNGHRVLTIVIDFDATKNDNDETVTDNDMTTIILKKSYHECNSYYSKYFRPGGFEAHHQIASGFATRKWLLLNHRNYKIDIIQTPDYGGLGVFLCDKELPPVIVFGHGCLNQISRYNFVRNDDHAIILKKLEMLSFECADAILTHSPLNREDLEQLTGRNVTLTTAPWLWEKELKLPTQNSSAITVAGGLQIIKGAVTAIEAIQICAEKNPGIHLHWFGGDSYSAKKHESVSVFLSKKYPQVWNKNFIWKNSLTRDETLAELAKSAFVIIPSLWETYGWTAIEAAYLGKAIIITDKTGSGFLFSHRQNAWIIPANKPQKLAEAIEILNNNSELRTSLGNNAKILIENVFDEKKIVEEKITLFSKIILSREPTEIPFEQRINFLKEYTTNARKIYYRFRAFIKKLAGK